MVTTTRRRKPRLKVVGHSLADRPRHRLVWDLAGHGIDVGIECWSYEDWELLAEWDRPPDNRYWHLPGFGYFVFLKPTPEEAQDIIEEIRLAQENWEARRGMGRGGRPDIG